ncbi:MAG: helix-turn-helix domain-containing protein [Bacteroides sp.]|nr:helix-turn-helix domain-containing protein [Bacteroides sp.]MCM1447272.1 helix-turn-helix domain-containing protein [Bacteroides sp.]MCM1515478.1 helix-turn-helix domain-containing protein [Paraprevotella sp.]
MKDRIRQLMLDKGMSQKNFASELCIAEATLSGIFNGRTRPTNLTVSAIHERFPDVNISWLMFGEGEMYLSDSREQPIGGEHKDALTSHGMSDDLFGQTIASATLQGGDGQGQDVNGAMSQGTHMGAGGVTGSIPSAIPPQVQYIERYIDKPQRRITEIRIFFDDGTYETFTP